MLTQSLKLIIASGLLYSGLSISAHAEDCPSNLPDQFSSGQLKACMNEISKLKELITDLAQTVDALSSSVTAPIAPSIPAGVVVAMADTRYSDSKGDEFTEGCPEGWIRFKEAEGRFILGANARSQSDNSGKYYVSLQDGEERVALTVSELPSHSHLLPTDGAANGNAQSLVHSANNDEGIGPGSSKTDVTGGNQPHNNMPPYIALYYCKKVR